MNSGKFLITYTIKEDNENALKRIENLLAQYDFKSEKDQSTYLGGDNANYTELQHRICAIRQYLNSQEEHITLYYADDNIISRD